MDSDKDSAARQIIHEANTKLDLISLGRALYIVDDFGLYWYENSVQVLNVNWRRVDSTVSWLKENIEALTEAIEFLDKKKHAPGTDENKEIEQVDSTEGEGVQ